eukprot:NODE_158_length_15065_cov_0.349125.p6 type:complete len:392 gc:universal NODE_158_length_15065_cov_0.349125:2588-1413(-)
MSHIVVQRGVRLITKCDVVLLEMLLSFFFGFVIASVANDNYLIKSNAEMNAILFGQQTNPYVIAKSIIYAMNGINGVDPNTEFSLEDKIVIRNTIVKVLHHLMADGLMKSVSDHLLDNDQFHLDCKVFRGFQIYFNQFKVFRALEHGMTTDFKNCKNQFVIYFKNLIKNARPSTDIDKFANYIIQYIPLHHKHHFLAKEDALDEVYSYYRSKITNICSMRLNGALYTRTYFFNLLKVYNGYDWIYNCLVGNPNNNEMIRDVYYVLSRYLQFMMKYENVLIDAYSLSKEFNDFTPLLIVLTEPGFILMRKEGLKDRIDEKLQQAIAKTDYQRVYWLMRIVDEYFGVSVLSKITVKVIKNRLQISVNQISSLDWINLKQMMLANFWGSVMQVA